MEITINTMDELLTFVKRKEVSPEDAINVFEKAFNIVCITFIDAVTRKSNLNKEFVINKIEKVIDAVKCDKDFKLSVVIFN